jgi:dephospho-CoA kinase
MGKKIAITGGIGSGKSTVSNILKVKGYPVYSCDEIYAELVNSKIYIDEIKKVFPTAVKQGKIDKKCLAEIIFSDKQERTRLNEIAHPLIMQTLLARMNESDSQIVFAEVPLLLE